MKEDIFMVMRMSLYLQTDTAIALFARISFCTAQIAGV